MRTLGPKCSPSAAPNPGPRRQRDAAQPPPTHAKPVQCLPDAVERENEPPCTKADVHPGLSTISADVQAAATRLGDDDTS
jgi:hypothetical protein